MVYTFRVFRQDDKTFNIHIERKIIKKFEFSYTELENNHLRNRHLLLIGAPPRMVDLMHHKDTRDMTRHCLDPDLDKSYGLGD
jgi:hypothetical protein